MNPFLNHARDVTRRSLLGHGAIGLSALGAGGITRQTLPIFLEGFAGARGVDIQARGPILQMIAGIALISAGSRARLA